MLKKLLIVTTIALFSLESISQTKITMQKESGIYTVPCKINGLPLKFIFDTGASDVSISLTEAIFMIKNGFLKKEDIGESVYYSIANGDVAKGTKLNIKEIEFAGLKLFNIEASIVHETSAPLLLGQSVISKLGKIQLDGNVLTVLTKGNNTYDYSNEKNASITNSSDNNTHSLEFDFKSLPLFSGTYNTSDLLVLDAADLVYSKKINHLCDKTTTILRKENDKFYFVKSGNVTGYVFVGYIMRTKL